MTHAALLCLSLLFSLCTASFYWYSDNCQNQVLSLPDNACTIVGGRIDNFVSFTQIKTIYEADENYTQITYIGDFSGGKNCDTNYEIYESFFVQGACYPTNDFIIVWQNDTIKPATHYTWIADTK
jgi:hypothetical protein